MRSKNKVVRSVRRSDDDGDRKIYQQEIFCTPAILVFTQLYIEIGGLRIALYKALAR